MKQTKQAASSPTPEMVTSDSILAEVVASLTPDKRQDGDLDPHDIARLSGVSITKAMRELNKRVESGQVEKIHVLEGKAWRVLFRPIVRIK